MKKIHWTQRPENKAKLMRLRKRQAKKAKKVLLSTPLPPSTDALHIPQDTFAYALGYVECWVEAYAKSAGVPAEALATKLGKVLHGKAGR